VRVRVIECETRVAAQQVPEMFCLVTDLLDWERYPAGDLALRIYVHPTEDAEARMRDMVNARWNTRPATASTKAAALATSMPRSTRRLMRNSP
jgi:hypothetical protein